jgi:hypothetical protein
MAKPPRCTICRHRERPAIDLALARGITAKAVAKRYDIGIHALYRHRKDHLTPAVKARLLAGPDTELDLENLKETEAQSLLAHVVALRHRIFGHLDLAEEVGDAYSAQRAVAQLPTNLELMARLLGELGVGSTHTTNILIAPQYLEMRVALVEALRPYPEAARAVSQALHRIETKAADTAQGPKFANGPAIRPEPALIEAKPINEEGNDCTH